MLETIIFILLGVALAMSLPIHYSIKFAKEFKDVFTDRIEFIEAGEVEERLKNAKLGVFLDCVNDITVHFNVIIAKKLEKLRDAS